MLTSYYTSNALNKSKFVRCVGELMKRWFLEPRISDPGWVEPEQDKDLTAKKKNRDPDQT